MPATRSASAELDPDVEYELRKIFYRTLYYEGERDETEAMRSGWSSASAQRRAYEAFLPHFDRDGSVLDLGCGDGRLLAFLCQNAAARLVPHGVDFLEESIEAARRSVLPGYAGNFVTENVARFEPGQRRYTYVITNPFYVAAREQGAYLRRCFNWLEPGGRLLGYEYAGASGFDRLLDVCLEAQLRSCALQQSPQVALVRCDC